MAYNAVEMADWQISEAAEKNMPSPDEWREKLGEFDWVILAVPSTDETKGMIGASELAAMWPRYETDDYIYSATERSVVGPGPRGSASLVISGYEVLPHEN